MQLEGISVLFSFIGGLGMFLYGMHVMANGLQHFAGGKMQRLMSFLTQNRLMAILVGTLVTAVIQSSSATTVMVVGFVNAGMLNLSQAVGVIMGANIGTTITAWLVSLSEFGSFLNPEFYAPLLLGIGAFVILFAKSDKKKQIGEILIGFAVLFIGLSFMSDAIKPYRDSPIFSQCIYCAWQKSAARDPDRYSCNGDYPELFCFGRHFADAGNERHRQLEIRSVYYARTEYRYLCDRAFIRRRFRQKRKTRVCHPSFL